VTTILVAADAEWVRNQVRTAFVGPGQQVIEVTRGQDVRAAVRDHDPDLVVLDLQIPAPNGVECTAEMLRTDPSARVLILSASGEQGDVLDAVKAGATGYLVKSASRSELLDAVRRVAAGQSLLDPLVTAQVLERIRHGADDEP